MIYSHSTVEEMIEKMLGNCYQVLKENEYLSNELQNCNEVVRANSDVIETITRENEKLKHLELDYLDERKARCECIEELQETSECAKKLKDQVAFLQEENAVLKDENHKLRKMNDEFREIISICKNELCKFNFDK